MTNQAIAQRLEQMALSLTGHGFTAICYQTSIKEQLGLDSLDMMDFGMQVSQEFDIDLPDDLGAHLETIDSCTAYIAAQVNERGG